MPYEVLEKQIKALPEAYLEDVAKYVQLLQYKVAILSQQRQTPSRIGLGKGLFTVPDDIHFGDDEILDMFEEQL